MGEFRVPLSEKLILVLLGVFVFALLFNFAYSMKHDLEGYQAIPMWLLLVLICLTAGPMRDRKLITYVVLLAIAFGLEYHHLKAVYKTQFDPFKHTFLILLIYGMGIIYFMLTLFARLDRLVNDHSALATEVKGLADEASRVAKLIEKSQRKEQEPAAEGGQGQGYVSYRRALTDLAGLRTAKDVPGFLARTLRDSFGMDRGLVLELTGAGAEGTVREAWGEGMPRSGQQMQAFKFPTSLVEMVLEKMGAVLESELAAEGSHTTDAAQLTDSGMDPLGLFPVLVKDPDGSERPAFLVVAFRPKTGRTGAQEWSESMEGVATAPRLRTELRIIPVQTVLDIAGQFLSRMKGRTAAG
ncbi:MAG: hypothetical protein HY815_19305 [Candidatus Riflebacteria bacterium]|nr:hypothetical protein [Candidatus Riflebacteria bacterium]